MMKLDWARDLARFGSLALLLGACVSSREPIGVGGESHFLRRCADQCGQGLDCIQSVCTRGCVVGKTSCSDLAPEAVCTAASVEPGEVAICDLSCSQDLDCAAISAEHRCDSGFCRAPIAQPLADAGSAAGNDAGGGSSSGLDQVFPCPENVVTDPSDVKRSIIQADSLVLQVAYGGGCKEHTFSLCFDPSFNESSPVQTTLRVIHDAHGDTCEAYPSQELRFDLSALAQQYERYYRSSAGLIETNFGTYAFGKLACDQRVMGASAQIADFVEQVPRECQTSADCVWAQNSTTCKGSCGAVASTEGAAQLATWLGVTSSAVCGNYEGDGCSPVLVPPCEPPSALACISGQCQETP